MSQHRQPAGWDGTDPQDSHYVWLLGDTVRTTVYVTGPAHKGKHAAPDHRPTMRRALVGALVLVWLLLLAPWQGQAVAGHAQSDGRHLLAPVTASATVQGHTATVTMWPCLEEDGSTPGQRFPCWWSGKASGNGYGQSYVLHARPCTEEELATRDSEARTGLIIALACDDIRDGLAV